MFNNLQQQKLQDLVFLPRGVQRDFAHANVALDVYIEELKTESPEKFHDHKTLKDRVFMDEPKSAVQCKRYVRIRSESPINIVPVKS